MDSQGTGSIMTKAERSGSIRPPSLKTGQLWRMKEANLLVGMVGKLMVHYKLGKPNALRIPNSCNSIKTIEKLLKSKKAVLD
jgi:hypothetical protein